MIDEENYLIFEAAIRRAAQFEWKVWRERNQNLQKYEVRRWSLNPEWHRFNIDLGELARLPKGYIDVILQGMMDDLYKPIIDLDWENYYNVPIDWRHVRMYGTPYEWHRNPRMIHHGLHMRIWDDANERWVWL